MSVEITDGGRTVTYICEWCGLTSKDDCEFVDIGWSVKDGKYIPGDELVCVGARRARKDGGKGTYEVFYGDGKEVHEED